MAKSKIKATKATSAGNGFKVKPLGDRVLVRELKKEGEKIVSGIIIPESAGEDRGARKGEVVAVGPGKYDDGKLISVGVKVGDKVLFQWGDKITVDGVEYEMVAESSILAVIQ